MESGVLPMFPSELYLASFVGLPFSETQVNKNFRGEIGGLNFNERKPQHMTAVAVHPHSTWICVHTIFLLHFFFYKTSFSQVSFFQPTSLLSEQCGRIFLVLFVRSLTIFKTSVLASCMVCAVVCLDAPNMESARLAASIKKWTAKDTLSVCLNIQCRVINIASLYLQIVML